MQGQQLSLFEEISQFMLQVLRKLSGGRESCKSRRDPWLTLLQEKLLISLQFPLSEEISVRTKSAGLSFLLLLCIQLTILEVMLSESRSCRYVLTERTGWTSFSCVWKSMAESSLRRNSLGLKGFHQEIYRCYVCYSNNSSDVWKFHCCRYEMTS